MPIIPAGALHKICTHLTAERAEKLEIHLNTICPQYGISDANIMHEFLANLCEESAEFTKYEENLRYSTPERLHAVWPTRFPTIESAKPYIKNPKGLAMKVYGSRKDLGNITADDGWAYRGSGPIQMTGKNNFIAFGQYMQKRFGIIKSPLEWADLLRNSDEWGIHSACWIFAIAKQLIDEAQRDEMTTIVKKINGGTTGMKERLLYLHLCKSYIPLAA